MKWLLRREYWEHKGAIFWAPLIVASIMCILIAAILALGFSADGVLSVSYEGAQRSMGSVAESISPDQKSRLVDMMTHGYMFIAAPLYFLFSFIVFFYCLGALYDERRDRSILFWKSLPISDGLTVLSKVAMAAVVAPLITIAIATVSSLFLLFVFSIALASKGIHVFGDVLSAPSLYLAPVQLVALIPVYLLWALPTIGWLLMVSSWARSKVFLWAVGAPLMSLALLSGANSLFQFHWNTSWFAENIVARGLFGLVPGAWFSFAGVTHEHLSQHAAVAEIFTQSWSTLASPQVWVGVVAGAAMIYVAIAMRRWREES
jgi:ABC-2 type transport system permease protein